MSALRLSFWGFTWSKLVTLVISLLFAMWKRLPRNRRKRRLTMTTTSMLYLTIWLYFLNMSCSNLGLPIQPLHLSCLYPSIIMFWVRTRGQTLATSCSWSRGQLSLVRLYFSISLLWLICTLKALNCLVTLMLGAAVVYFNRVLDLFLLETFSLVTIGQDRNSSQTGVERIPGSNM